MKKLTLLLLTVVLVLSGCSSGTALTKEQIQTLLSEYTDASGSLLSAYEVSDVPTMESLCEAAKSALDKMAELIPPDELSDAHKAFANSVGDEKAYIDNMLSLAKQLSADKNSDKEKQALDDFETSANEEEFNAALLALIKQLR